MRVRLRRLAGSDGAAPGRLPHDRRQLQPGDDHDRPRLRRPHLSRAARPRRSARRTRARAARCAAADDGRADRAQPRDRTGGGRCAGGARDRADRRGSRCDQARRGPRALPQRRQLRRPAGAELEDRPLARRPRRRLAPGGRAAGLHARWSRRRLRLDARGARGAGHPRPAGIADRPGARGGVGARLGRVRAGGRPRQARQRRHRLLDREPRPDGRAHRRLRHGRPADDAVRRGLPGAARRVRRGHARGRRRDGRLEHPVRAPPRHR